MIEIHNRFHLFPILQLQPREVVITSGFFSMDTSKMEWSDPPRGYYQTEVKQKVLYKNEETGALMSLLKFPVGLGDDLHSHPEANQHAFWLDGELMDDENKRVPLKGTYIHFPKGVKHGKTVFTKESIALFYWDGPQK